MMNIWTIWSSDIKTSVEPGMKILSFFYNHVWQTIGFGKDRNSQYLFSGLGYFLLWLWAITKPTRGVFTHAPWWQIWEATTKTIICCETLKWISSNTQLGKWTGSLRDTSTWDSIFILTSKDTGSYECAMDSRAQGAGWLMELCISLNDGPPP